MPLPSLRLTVLLVGVAGLALALGPGCALLSGGGPVRCERLAPGTRTCALDERTYVLHVPASYTGEQPVPLVLDLHGYGSTSAFQAGYFGSGFQGKADREGFVYVAPQGIENSWHAQGRCCAFQRNPPDDVEFLLGVVAAVRAAGNVDPNRIYVAGFSNGGSMAFTLACRTNVFAGVASISYSLSGGASVGDVVSACRPGRPLPVIHFHGTADQTSPYARGAVGSLGARESLDAWTSIQGCEKRGVSEKVSRDIACETHASCRGGVAVRLCTVERGQHYLFRDVTEPGIPDQVWEFWQRYPR